MKNKIIYPSKISDGLKKYHEIVAEELEKELNRKFGPTKKQQKDLLINIK